MMAHLMLKAAWYREGYIPLYKECRAIADQGGACPQAYVAWTKELGGIRRARLEWGIQGWEGQRNVHDPLCLDSWGDLAVVLESLGPAERPLAIPYSDKSSVRDCGYSPRKAEHF